jgi:ligand-binding sensor domain-containing protein
MLRLLFIILFFLCTIPLALMAQEPFMRQYTIKDGLPQQQVMCYFKDSRGFLWIGTKGGLSRFDGKKIENYDESNGIPHNIVRNIAEDEKGNIWFATILGMVCFDGVKFTTYRNETLGDASMTIINAQKIFIHSKDWILWENGHYVSKAEYFKGIDIAKIRRTYYDKTTDNMYVCYGDKEVIHLFKRGKIEKIGFLNLDFTDIKRLPNGGLFFGRFVDGFVKYEVYKQELNGAFKLIYKKNDTEIALFEPFPYDIYAGHFLQKNQFYIPKGEKGKFKCVLNPISEPQFQSASFYEIHGCDFYTNQSNHIWVNSEQGMWQVFDEAFELIKNPDLNNVWAVTEDNNQHLFFATYSTVSIIRYDGKQFKTIFDEKQNLERIVGFYFGASTDKRGNLYFPHHYGILRYDGRQFSQLSTVSASLSDRFYCEFSFYDKERDWLFECGYQHVKITDLSKNTMRTLTPQQGLHKSEDTEGVVKDTDGSFWIFGKQGITHWQPETNVFKNYTINNERGIEFGGISGCVDAQGTLWIGNTSGLCYFDRQNDIFHWVAPDFKHYFTAVTNYDKDHLILGTADGLIYFLDLKKWYESHIMSLKTFDNTNGYQGGKIQHSGIFKDSKGDFWILSATGLVRLHPEILNLNQGEAPRVYINQIDTIHVRLNHQTDTILLRQGQNYFNAETGLIFFDPSVKNYFSYRLRQQNDANWSQWTEESNHLFTDLSSGVYNLEVKARPLGYDETMVDSISIKVDLPLLEEPWFRKWVVGLVCLLLFLFVFQFFKNRYLGQQLQKNTVVLRQLEVQTLQAQMNPHFIYNILSSLQNVIYQNDSKTAEFLLLRLSKLMRSFLEASVKSNDLKAYNSQNDTTLQEEIDLLKLYIEFEQFINKDKFTYEINVETGIDAQNFMLPPVIIQPYVENAIKHGILYKKGVGHLILNFSKLNEDTLVCDILDDGVGIEQAKVIQSTSLKSHKSMSTYLILERIKRLNLLGYDIATTTENRVGGGTKVNIIFGYSKT